MSEGKVAMNGGDNEKQHVEEESTETVEPVSLLCSQRLALAIIAFTCFVFNYAQRIGMSVAIVCMVNHTALDLMDVAESSPLNSSMLLNGSVDVSYREAPEENICLLNKGNASVSLEDGPFVWTKEVQGHVLGSFFYGYLISQIPGGILAERFGGKWVYGASLGLATIATLLTPMAANFSFALLIFLRVIVGVGSGVMFPAMHAMWGQWAPPYERSRLAGISYAGAMMGSVLAMPISGVLCQHGFAGGWGSIFYVIGICSMLVVVLWLFLTSNTPSQNRFISKAEKQYITSSLKGQVSEGGNDWCSVPWLKFATSGPVWAIIVANFCSDWGLYTLLTNIPTFYKEVLYFDISSNGLFSALPFIGLWANMNISPIIIDMLRGRQIFSTTVGRKIFNSIGMLGAAIFLVGLSFVDCTQTGLAVALLTVAVTLSGTAYSGFLVNHMDIAPKFAGTLFGISNGLASMSGFVAPPVAAAITKDRTRGQWQIVFFVAGAVYAFGAIFYVIFGSGELQPWAAEEKAPEEVMLKAKDVDEEEKNEQNA